MTPDRLDPAHRAARKEAFEAGLHTAAVEMLETAAFQDMALEVLLLRSAVAVLSAELARRDRTLRALREIIHAGAGVTRSDDKAATPQGSR